MRRITAIILSLVIIITSSVSYAQPSNWAISEIGKAKDLNLVTNEILTDFQKNITREEFSGLVVKLYEKLLNEKLAEVSSNPFSDTNNFDVLKANSIGVVEGVGNSLFEPNSEITREQIAVMFYRVIKAINPSLVTKELSSFEDKDSISSWASDSVGYMSNRGVINGVGNNQFGPKASTTREQAIALALRTYTTFEGIKREKDTSLTQLSSQQIGKLSDSVVKIIIISDGVEYTGSGFFYDKGKLATNFHVIEKAESITIEYENGRVYNGKVIVTGYDKGIDLATLSINDTATEPLPLGNSALIVRGQKIYTIGSPIGFKNTLSDGLISAVRVGEIQITAPITFGSSGGALFDEYGRVIGVTTSIVDGAGSLGFAVPINSLKALNKNRAMTLEEFFAEAFPKPQAPKNVKATLAPPYDIDLYWGEVEADYYKVYQSYEEEWLEINDEFGDNYWFYENETKSLTVIGFEPGDTVRFKIVSVLDGVESDAAITNYVSIPIPKKP